ncbi:MAG: di-trans,poly-cis-decaprenylcistransferase [Candidatus Nealsonbacteria bacterium]|nr:di-trans,poly-cis-decaprenylcistransferase [Candidatus Nealsonbacteria bacterium]
MKDTPRHVGIILDGNRRWARKRGLPTFEGHKRGLEKIKDVVGWCRQRGVKTLTLFVFSTENWHRSKKEVDYLMKLAERAVRENSQELSDQDIRVRVIGLKEKLPAFVKKAIKEAEEGTKDNTGMTLNFALSYGGRAEIVQAVRKIISEKVEPTEITEDLISKNLWTSDLDLIIRTGKEQRLSNFLIWQAAYSELYFLDKYWPEFDEKELEEAFEDYRRRKRRFGR